jgi:hypothetical protein
MITEKSHIREPYHIEHLFYIPLSIQCPLKASYSEFAGTPMEAPLDGLHVKYDISNVSLSSYKMRANDNN